MTRDDEVRLLEIATELVTDFLRRLRTSSINTIGAAIVDLTLQCDNVEEIKDVGYLLGSLTERDRKSIEKGERWGKRSRLLSQDEAMEVLCGLTIAQAKVFAERCGYATDEVFGWLLEQRDIHGGALWALGDRDEMAKITGETR
jgi:hypothetical protein